MCSQRYLTADALGSGPCRSTDDFFPARTLADAAGWGCHRRARFFLFRLLIVEERARVDPRL
jgi:hypothetical protein